MPGSMSPLTFAPHGHRRVGITPAGTHAFLIFDEVPEEPITRLYRRLYVRNPIARSRLSPRSGVGVQSGSGRAATGKISEVTKG